MNKSKKSTLVFEPSHNKKYVTPQINNDKSKVLSNPKYVGPGTWHVIHALAYAAKTKNEQQQFVKTMHTICETFPCENCKEHCKEYIKNNPMNKLIDVEFDTGEKLGLFMWTWKFHNAVNQRIGKNTMSWSDAYSLYSGVNKKSSCDECSGKK